MAKEKRKISVVDAAFMKDHVEKIQNAYRKGDIDLMDLLDNLIEQSVAFRKKYSLMIITSIMK